MVRRRTVREDGKGGEDGEGTEEKNNGGRHPEGATRARDLAGQSREPLSRSLAGARDDGAKRGLRPLRLPVLPVFTILPVFTVLPVLSQGTTGSTMCDGSDGVQYTRCVALVKSAAFA